MPGRHLNLRKLVVGVDTKVPTLSGEYVTAINFDNAATTPPLCAVMQELAEFAPWYSSIHRGAGHKSMFCSDVYEEGRSIIKRFVGADAKRDVLIYTKNTTEAINLLSYALLQDAKKKVVLSTCMEHLANDLPWRDIFKIDYIKVDDCGRLSLTDLEDKLEKYRGNVELVAVTGASNVTGYVNPIYEIARVVHKYGVKLLVDGAQLVPHFPINMKPYESEEHIDYLVFSAHKMYAPFGIGILIAPKETFAGKEPIYKGGGAVNLVSHQFVEWDTAPYKEEAGTSNAMGVVALVAAIKKLEQISMQAIYEHEKMLFDYMFRQLEAIDELEIYRCAAKGEERIGIISFVLPEIHHAELAKMLAYEAGIAVRSGLFCAHPYVEKLLGLTEKDLHYYQKHPELPFPGLVRLSLGMYNNYGEIDIFIKTLRTIAGNVTRFKQKYNEIEKKEAETGSQISYLPRRKMP
ncbi:MAG: aminotransferase class V-fold PLP-dependent enzyme [Pelosinus sp.]|nr:aminotransferase class V-fold PLP-dependent enzyme [Pelosinus sp.]